MGLALLCITAFAVSVFTVVANIMDLNRIWPISTCFTLCIQIIKSNKTKQQWPEHFNNPRWFIGHVWFNFLTSISYLNCGNNPPIDSRFRTWQINKMEAAGAYYVCANWRTSELHRNTSGRKRRVITHWSRTLISLWAHLSASLLQRLITVHEVHKEPKRAKRQIE